MTEYITHRRFKGVAVCGVKMNIPYGTKLYAAGNFIISNDKKAICSATSFNAHKYFAVNDDGKGLERGKLSHAIAFGKRRTLCHTPDGHGCCRFSEDEQNMLRREWGHFLKQDFDTILFNHSFFIADVEELQKIADALKIKIKE